MNKNRKKKTPKYLQAKKGFISLQSQIKRFGTETGIAQLVERRSPKPQVEGSNPSARAIHLMKAPIFNGAFDLY